MQLRRFGHSTFSLSNGTTSVLVDPFLTDNPQTDVGPEDVEADVILISHGHFDHMADAVAIAQRTGATVVAITELAHELAAQGLQDVRDPNLGGTVTFDWGWVKMVPAWHSSVSAAGTAHIAAGLLISFDGTLVYHLGDTCLFSDLALVARRGTSVDVALVPIGGHYTMDRIDAVTAVELVEPRTVIPVHYDTFPAISTDAAAFKADVESRTSARVVVLEPGATVEL